MQTICPACGSSKTRPSALARDFFYRTTWREFAYRRCKQCKTIFQTDPPPPSAMSDYYPGSYGPHHVRSSGKDRFYSLINRVHSSLCSRYPFFKKRNEFFSEMNSDDLLLDYGCGGGEALDAAQRQGAKTFGIDFADSLHGELQRRGHATSPATADWQSVVLAAGGATHIRLNHSLEHLHQPEELLDDLARVCRPGAKLHISVPNPQGLSARWFGRYWRGLEAPRHIVLFSAGQIERLLRQHGFTQIAQYTEPTAKDFARSLSVIGGDADKNFAPVDPAPENALALLAGLILTLPAPLFGAGDRLHIFARRPE
jgi:2-polyprenyl-3-methyl-5-hydroxy-6-metoxy-1,4-benzoquinol methylase